MKSPSQARIQGIQRVSDTSTRWPLHSIEATRRAEAAALAMAAPQALMERAGLAVARLALALHPHAGTVQVWAGPGNNGGDGLVAARHLHLAGRAVTVQLLADAARLAADARAALHTARAAGVRIHVGLPAAGIDPAAPDLAIDAILGLGASRPPSGDIAAAIAALLEGSSPVMAVDLPSGLHGDTGTLLGEAAVLARHTLALLSLKPGCHTGVGRDHAGTVWLDNLDTDAGPPSAWLGGVPTPGARRSASHKGSYGDVAIVGGDTGMVGAAWLAARSALASGAGRVYCSPLAPDADLLDTQRPELMGRQAWWRSAPEVLSAATVACGCGGGAAIAQALPSLLLHVQRLVLDADALNAIAADADLRAALKRRAGQGLHTILTPHPLEAARLLGTSSAQVQADRLQAAHLLAEQSQAAVVLKGSGSVIAAPDLSPVINASGNAALATAGTGDVLAGWIAGLWAQAPQSAPADVAAQAVAWHGHVADRWLARGHAGPLRASDLIEQMAGR